MSRLLAERGAVIVDADLIARQVVEPGGPAYQPVVDRFGPGVVLDDGTLDRAALAKIVFSDPDALADLNAITHPAVGVVIAERLAEGGETDHVVILDVPLLVESKRANTTAVIVVDCPEDEALRRAVARAPRGRRPAPDGRPGEQGRTPGRGRLRHRQLRAPDALPAQIDKAWAWFEALRG